MWRNENINASMASKKCGVNGENENGSVMTIEEEMKMA
jgi:hypothetical protein